MRGNSETRLTKDIVYITASSSAVDSSERLAAGENTERFQFPVVRLYSPLDYNKQTPLGDTKREISRLAAVYIHRHTWSDTYLINSAASDRQILQVRANGTRPLYEQFFFFSSPSR